MFEGDDMNLPLVDLKRQYESIKDEIDSRISEVLQSTQFILGNNVELFEQEFAQYCGVKYGIGNRCFDIEFKRAWHW